MALRATDYAAGPRPRVDMKVQSRPGCWHPATFKVSGSANAEVVGGVVSIHPQKGKADTRLSNCEGCHMNKCQKSKHVHLTRTLGRPSFLILSNRAHRKSTRLSTHSVRERDPPPPESIILYLYAGPFARGPPEGETDLLSLKDRSSEQNNMGPRVRPNNASKLTLSLHEQP